MHNKKGGIFICTAISFEPKAAIFGRTLDVEHRFDETVTVTPRHFVFSFRNGGQMKEHFAFIGMAFVKNGYPLYYDGMNEHGLYIAGLNFPKSAEYLLPENNAENLASFEVIPAVLGKCRNLTEAKDYLEHVNIVSTDFDNSTRATPLHWFVADKNGSFTAEPMQNGLEIKENPTGVLTNEPPFEKQMEKLRAFLSTGEKNMSTENIPGGFSSGQRFIRAAVLKSYSPEGKNEEDSVLRFFHLLDLVSVPDGCIENENGGNQKTVCFSCASAESGIYYYKTFSANRVVAVDLKKERLESDLLVSFPLIEKTDFYFQN